MKKLKEPGDYMQPEAPRKPGRAPIGERAMTPAEKQAAYRERQAMLGNGSKRARQLAEVASELDTLATMIRIKGDELADARNIVMSAEDAARQSERTLDFLRDLLLHVELARIAVPQA